MSSGSVSLYGPAVAGPVCFCSKQSPPPPMVEPCRHQGLTIKCQHGGRQIQIDDNTPQQNRRLCVVAGPDAMTDQIECTTRIIEGPCSGGLYNVMPHKGLVFFLNSGSDNRALISKSDTVMLFNARSPSFAIDNALRFFWLPAAPVQSYSVYVDTCFAKELIGEVVAYPDMGWDVNVTAGFNTELLWKHQKEEKVFKYNEVNGSKLFSLTPTVKWSYDGQSRELSGTAQASIDKVLSALNWAAEKLEYFLPLLTDLTGTKFSMNSMIVVSGKWQWEEIPGQPTCGIKGNVNLKFDPLIEISLEQDITDTVLKLMVATPAGPVASKLIELRLAAKNAELNFEAKNAADKDKWFLAKGYVNGGIYLTVTGSVGFQADWTKEASSPEWSGTETSAATKIGFELKASMEGKWEGKLIWVETSAGATFEMGGGASLSAEKIQAESTNGDIFLGCLLKFSGLDAYVSGEIEGGIKWAQDEETDENAWDKTKQGTYKQETTEGDTKSTTQFDGGVSKDGYFGGASTSSETTATNAAGDEYTSSKGEKAIKGTVGEDGASGEASGKYTVTIIAPRTWNFTRDPDASTTALPLGPFKILTNQ